ncbi:MAG: AMP-binding protein [Myxococcota bacterium]
MRELSLLSAAAEVPDRPCLVTRNQAWSFADVASRVAAAIDALEERGVVSGSRVAIAPKVDLDSIVWLYALFEMGCPAVLLHPRLTAEERAHVSRLSAPTFTIDGPPSATPRVGMPPRPTVPSDRTLAIVSTSGTGGAPRGAVLSRRAFVASSEAHAANLGWTSDDRWLLTMPPAHVGGLSIVTRCLIARRAVVVAEGHFSADRVAEAASDRHVTLISVVPTMLARLLALSPTWVPSPSLRAVLVGGALSPPALVERAVERGVPVVTTYGCTEACSQVTTQSLDQVGSVGSGAPLQGVGVRIVDGEIQLSGPTLMDRYEGDHPAPWTADGWFRTRDAGTFTDDGQLLVLGRLDDMIITGGENVAPAEVEAALEALPEVAEACVFSMPHESWGAEVVAAVVASVKPFDRAAVRRALRDHLASFKHPKRLALLPALPLNRNGKVDRAAVRIRCADLLAPFE